MTCSGTASAIVIGTCSAAYVLYNNICNACTTSGSTCSATTFTVIAPIVCLTGYYTSSTTTCASCSTSTGLYAGSTGSTAIVG